MVMVVVKGMGDGRCRGVTGRVICYKRRRVKKMKEIKGRICYERQL